MNNNNNTPTSSISNTPNKKKLASSTSLSNTTPHTTQPTTTTSPSNPSTPTHGFLQKTLNHLPLFFTNHNFTLQEASGANEHNHAMLESSHQTTQTSSVLPKREFFKLKLKNISPSISPSSSPTSLSTNTKYLLTPFKRHEHFLFNESDTSNATASHVDESNSTSPNNQTSPGIVGSSETAQLSPKTNQFVKANPQKQKLKHQAFSLSSAFSSLTSSTLLIPHLASNNAINNSLLQQQNLASTSPTTTQSSEKTITKTGSSKQIVTTVDTLTSKTTLLNSGLLFSRSNKNLHKTNYKEHINTKNVRRRSSTLNANMCFLSNKCSGSSSNHSTLQECALATNQFLKAINKMNSKSDETTLNNSPNGSHNSISSGSVTPNLEPTIIGLHATSSNRISVNSSIGVIVGASDIKFRKRLLKLQQRQQDFTYAASTFLSTGLERRKKAFAADNLSYTDYDETEEFKDEFNDNDNDKSNKSVIRRLSRAVSTVVSSFYYLFSSWINLLSY